MSKGRYENSHCNSGSDVGLFGYLRPGNRGLLNIDYGGPNVPDYLSDGTTKLSGPQFTAELMAGPTVSNLTSFATTPFLSGNGAGYFLGGSQTITIVNAGATAFVQLNIWNTNTGATFDAARRSGLANAWAQSPTFPVVTSPGPFCDPPCLPNPLVGLPSLILNGPTQSPLVAFRLTNANTLLFSWLANAPFFVQQNLDLNTTNWTSLTNTPVTFGAENQVILTPPNGTMFYSGFPVAQLRW
jgi:hypothetical protein